MKRKMKRISLCILLVLTLVTCLPGCSKVDLLNKGDETDQSEEVIEIGMSFDSFVIERWRRERDIFVSVAQELGARVNVQSASGDLEEQKKQIDYFIDKGVDVIVIICIDSKGLAEQVNRAKNEGIKVIAYDRLIADVDLDLYISFDSEMVGSLMGEGLVKNGLKSGKVLMLNGPTTDHNVSLLESGFQKVMDQNQIDIVEKVYVENWKAELAAEYIYDHPDVVEDVDAIMCGNDNIATQVVYALRESRIPGVMPIVGQDADLEACQRIVEGSQVMTVYKQVEQLAARAAECAVELAKGKYIVGEDVGKIQNGKYNVTYVHLLPVAVNAENMEEVIIESGFHLREDVYLNVKASE